jgi:AraC-like DNA-binding protein
MITVPRDALTVPIQRVDRLLCTPLLSGKNRLLAAIEELVRAMRKRPELFELLESEIASLLRDLVDELLSCSTQNTNHLIARIRILRMRTIVLRNVRNPDLSSEFIAKCLHVGKRTIYRAAHLQETIVASIVREHRCRGAYNELISSDPSETQIGALAAQWGYESHAQFTRDFKKVFDETPTKCEKIVELGPDLDNEAESLGSGEVGQPGAISPRAPRERIMLISTQPVLWEGSG